MRGTPWSGPARPGRRRRAVALVGIDGSGKTTQAHRLAAALTAAGVPARYWRNAGGRRWFTRLARRLGRADAQRLLGRGGLLFVESVLRWLAIAQALLCSRARGEVAVMDRYAACQYASILAHGGGRFAMRAARLAYAVFPRPDVTFWLTVDPGTAYRRIELRGTDHESVAYLAAAADAYGRLPEREEFVVVDGTGDPDRVAAAVWDRLTDPAVPGGQPAPARHPGGAEAGRPNGPAVPGARHPADRRGEPAPAAPRTRRPLEPVESVEPVGHYVDR
ncbi:MAG TPA: thymidylate kinase [Pilimelia sp.]|nr:thymidylate kinase [Pilimelia sp.]